MGKNKCIIFCLVKPLDQLGLTWLSFNAEQAVSGQALSALFNEHVLRWRAEKSPMANVPHAPCYDIILSELERCVLFFTEIHSLPLHV